MTYKILDWDDNVLELTPGEIIQKLLTERDEYGNFFTSYTELARVCQVAGFPGISARSIAVLCIRHEILLLAEGIQNHYDTSDQDSEAEPIESVARNTNNIVVSHGIEVEDLNGFGDDSLEDDLYEELEDKYKFDGRDEYAMSYFFMYLLNDPDPGVKINLQKYISLLVLNIIFHTNVEYDLSDEEYEWSNAWSHTVAAEIWRAAIRNPEMTIDLRGLSLFVEKLYMASLYENLGAERIPAKDVNEAIEAEQFYTIECQYGTEAFWVAWREAESLSKEETDAIISEVEAEKLAEEWEKFIDTAAYNIIADVIVHPMWNVFTDEAIWWDDFEASKYPRGW